jgi:hypothetical protein
VADIVSEQVAGMRRNPHLEAANGAGVFPTVISAGIALHHGEAAYAPD